MNRLFTTAVIVHSFLRDRWERLRETGDAGEIDEKTIIMAVMSAATIGILIVIVAALNARGDSAAGYLE